MGAGEERSGVFHGLIKVTVAVFAIFLYILLSCLILFISFRLAFVETL